MYSKQKSLNFGNYVPNDKVLNKKVPENPKYKYVKPAIDTGKNVRKHIDELKEKQKTCSHKKDEVFKRIKAYTFIKLAIAVAIDSPKNENDIINPASNLDVSKPPESSQRRCAANVLMGIGELDALNEKKKSNSAAAKQVNCTSPYLLLDVRDRDAFSKCHIVTAKHYPFTMLSRSVNYETEDMKLFKNVQRKYIIIYDDDESIAARVATTLVERGYENIYLLSGGLKIALEICPRGLTTSSHTSLPVHMLTQNGTSQAQKAQKEYFSQEDINTIQHYIDFYPNKGGNHLLNSSCTQSLKSTVSSRSHINCIPASSRTSSTSSRITMCSSTITKTSTDQKQQQSASSRGSKISHTNCSSTKNNEQIHFKSAIDNKTRIFKKAPWK